jgi:LysM repeat protein
LAQSSSGAGIICNVIEEPTNSFDGGPAACPFVAFEDDRDHRSDAPDYRHRCFAAPEPEPRAFPHQERYCLAAGFAACPVFLDWARQEAAGVKSSAAPVAATVVEDEELSDDAPAFLAARPRPSASAGVTTPKRTADEDAGLWSYDSETKRTPSPSAPPPPSSLGQPAVAMARRGPTHPGWENPPRLENFPRLRGRDDRRANQPLLVVAVFVAAVMVALVLYPIIMTPSRGLGPGNNSPLPSVSLSASPSPKGSVKSADPRASFIKYTVRSGDYLAKIAIKFNLQPWEIQMANPDLAANPDHIEVGQVIYIPPAGFYTQPPQTPRT